MSFNINMSDSTLRKIKKNVTYLESIRPAKTSQYRSTADAIIIQYATREIVNIKTAENLILKLSSKRPAITAKKFNDYVETNKPIVQTKSLLDKDIDTEDDYQPITAKKKTTITSTPKQKMSIKKKVPSKLYNWFIRANIKATTTFEKTTKNRQTKQLDTNYYSIPLNQNINKTIIASSSAEAQQIFENDFRSSITADNDFNYKKTITIDDIDYKQTINESSFTAIKTDQMLMTRADIMT